MKSEARVALLRSVQQPRQTLPMIGGCRIVLAARARLRREGDRRASLCAPCKPFGEADRPAKQLITEPDKRSAMEPLRGRPMRDDDDDQPGPGDSEAFVESMLDEAFAAVAGLEIHSAAQRLADIAMRFEQGLIEQFNFTAEEAHNSARQFLTRALDEITRAMREEVLRSKLGT
jgi:hypothetical protein